MSSRSPLEEWETLVQITQEEYNELLDAKFRLELLTAPSTNLGTPVLEESSPAKSHCVPFGSSRRLTVEIGQKGEITVAKRQRTEGDVAEAVEHEGSEGKAFARATLSKGASGEWIVKNHW